MASETPGWYTCGSCLSYSLKFYLLHSAIQLVLYSPYMALYLTVAFQAHSTMLQHLSSNHSVVGRVSSI